MKELLEADFVRVDLFIEAQWYEYFVHGLNSDML